MFVMPVVQTKWHFILSKCSILDEIFVNLKYLFIVPLHKNSSCHYVINHLLTCRVVNVCLAIGCWKIIDDLIEKVFPLYVFRYAINCFPNKKKENKRCNHDRGWLIYFRRNMKILKNRRSRPTALNIKINFQQCPPNWMLPNPAKFLRTTLRRIRQVLLCIRKIIDIKGFCVISPRV